MVDVGRWISIALCLALIAGCSYARTLPQDRTSATLYRDMQRLVSIRAAAGWQVDRLEIEGLLPEVLMSLCQVPVDRREALRTWLESRIAALGGPVEDAWRERGKKRDEVTDLLQLTRIRDALDHAMASAEADCPFWLEPDPEFAGRQISDDRWQFTVGGGGKGIVVNQGGQRDLQFGGAGRFVLGRNFGSRLGFYSGVESGASAGFPRDEGGDRGNLVLAIDTMLPVIVRYRLVNSYFEVEAGYVNRVTEEDWSDFSHGVHVGLAFGGRASRVRWFFPGAVFGVSYEHIAADGDNLHLIKMGFRAALDLDF